MQQRIAVTLTSVMMTLALAGCWPNRPPLNGLHEPNKTEPATQCEHGPGGATAVCGGTVVTRDESPDVTAVP